jgi:hypothetical protein
MDRDPFFNRLRTNPEFEEIRQDAIACHENFIANRLKAPNSNNAESSPD